MELASQVDAFRKRGLAVVSIIPEPVDAIREFASRFGIRYPILSDFGSVTIKRFELVDPDFKGEGLKDIPYAATFRVDAQGVVRDKFFEAEGDTRRTGGSMLLLEGEAGIHGRDIRAEHFTLRLSQSNAEAAPGQRITLALEFELAESHHFYAPGDHKYRPLTLRLEPDPLLTLHATRWPEPRPYLFAPLNETVPVYEGRFRALSDVTFELHRALERLKAGNTSVTITGSLDYQVCSDTVCYPPRALPVRWDVTLQPWAR